MTRADDHHDDHDDLGQPQRDPARSRRPADPIAEVLASTARVAVVGLSADPNRPSNEVARALLAAGYEVVPVNPNLDTVLGQRAYGSLAEVPGPIDLVDVFRAVEHAPQVAREAAAVGAAALWLQLGLRSEEARATAEQAGLRYVEDACLAVEVRRHGATPVRP